MKFSTKILFLFSKQKVKKIEEKMGTIFWKCSPSYLVQYFRYFWDLVSGTNYQITSKKIAKSPSPQLLKITKSPIFLGTNHQITNKKIAKSPSPQLFKITKSPIFSGTNHQITNKKTAQSPITKNTSPPPYWSFPHLQS